jgi:hypothetical protein
MTGITIGAGLIRIKRSSSAYAITWLPLKRVADALICSLSNPRKNSFVSDWES